MQAPDSHDNSSTSPSSRNGSSLQTDEGSRVPAAHSRESAPSGGSGIAAVFSGKPVSFYVAIGIAVVALMVASVLAFVLLSGGSAGRDPNAAMGQLEGKTTEEIQAELDRIVEEGMFNISIASTVQMADGASEADLRIENVPNNPYLMKVELTRDDTGEVVYTSGLIEPNHHIQKAKLDVHLAAGEYPCTAVFYAYSKDDEQMVGQAAAKLIVTVQN